jgi:tetratricopeptide (TPR) repeat protein
VERAEAAALLEGAARAYNGARAAAAQGRFADALRLLEDAASGGLSENPMVRRLRDLCETAVGTVPVPAALRDAYEAARAEPDDGAGMALLAPHLTGADGGAPPPALLPLAKLVLLRLAALPGVTGGTAAEAVRRRLLAALPAEPDLSRWRFAEAEGAPSPPPSPLSAAVPARREGGGKRALRGPKRPSRPVRPASVRPRPAAVATEEPLRWRALALLSGGASLGAVAAAGVAIALSLSALRRPAAVAPSPPRAVVPAIAPSPAVSPAPPPRAVLDASARALPPALAREQDEARRAADGQTARRWLREALRARRDGRPAAALRLADAAFALSSHGYVGEESLLLGAQASDTMNSPDAARRWARIADARPDSGYAPLGLLMAARAARRQGRVEEADRHAERLRSRYPRSREAARAGG